ncbi:Nif3-like dinuclear metal center hexameric protein [Thermoflavimicrobium dichotomicum]|uniref:GTP cyclohydrolase 1 type 2 homolog n=1 Tax=Thermoflavimicrobium dichotomicum TaxID=46223 RepID=A0A1I3NG21_9BACL|nr:Nif3-like dinuclear metal center hexameric protein [Thermoflavimicrobium dichotomicum]SFJ08224.1 dinuclear metal center protein, YbgI/SA1388 family [Thermoflavimicrobium dichotomicum]
MSISGRELIRVMDDYASPKYAWAKDRIGLQVGNPDAEVKGILVTLDVTEAVVDEAIQKGANWIVAHHAVIFHPLTHLRTDLPAGRLMAKLMKHDLQVFIAHTNLDATEGGVNDVLAEKLQLEETRVLVTEGTEKLKKLVVFVPMDHHEKVLQAMGEAGAGWIGNYSHCTFNVQGIGTFLPQEGSNPFIGKQGELEKVEEIRLETIITERNQHQVVRAMLQAHPYEEVAYDIYPLDLNGAEWGYGKIGRLKQSMTLKELAEKVKRVYRISGLRMVGDPNKLVEKVAILGGSGARYFMDAKRKGADVYITGDIDFHTAQDALAAGMCLIDPGHHVEHLVVERICQVLKEKWGEKVPVYASQIDTNPFSFV